MDPLLQSAVLMIAVLYVIADSDLRGCSKVLSTQWSYVLLPSITYLLLQPWQDAKFAQNRRQAAGALSFSPDSAVLSPDVDKTILAEFEGLVV